MEVYVRTVETRTVYKTYVVEADSVIAASRDFSGKNAERYKLVGTRDLSSMEHAVAAARKSWIDSSPWRLEAFKQGDDD